MKEQDRRLPLSSDEPGREEYDEMELLERLETLREDMEELGVTSLAQLVERIDALHRKLDER